MDQKVVIRLEVTANLWRKRFDCLAGNKVFGIRAPGMGWGGKR
jgi:hypothetical protein